MFSSCQNGGESSELSETLCYYHFTCKDRKMVAIANIERIYTKIDGEVTSTFSVIGPIAIVEQFKDDDFLLAPFTLRESRGVWKTKKGDLNSGSPYFVGADHEPQLLGVISNNEVTMEGEWDPRVGGIILLSELIGDTDYSELPARKKLIMILEGQANQ